MFEDLEEKMKYSWRLRWHHRWEKLKLDISEWIYGLYARIHKRFICFWLHREYGKDNCPLCRQIREKTIDILKEKGII